MASSRKTLTFETKKKIIADFKTAGLSKAAFAKSQSIPRTSLNKILAAESRIDEISNGKRKRQRESPYEKVEEALVLWMKYARSQGVPISCLILKEKALQIAKELGENEFSASNGWIQRFKLRYDISFKKICGEAAHVDVDLVEKWKNSVLSDVCKRFKPCDIFNIDECGLFYRVLPDKTLSFKDEKCVGGKKSKERLTVTLAVNMDGSEKLTPLVIGKFKRPRCFKTVKSLPVRYESNRKAWMTSEIWERVIKHYDRHFSKFNRKVVFIADNCSAHCDIPNLKSIKLIFLPPNVTSVLQPLDQGVIQNVKVNYRKLLMKDMILAIDDKRSFLVSVLDAIFYIDKSWNLVSSKCISNCFQHAGFESKSETDQFSDEDDCDVPLSELAQHLRKRGCVFSDELEYANVDNGILTSYSHDTEAVISEIVSQVNCAENISSGESDTEIDDTVAIVSKAEALSALDVVRRFFANSSNSEEHFQTVNRLERVVQTMKSKEKQTSISEFFK